VISYEEIEELLAEQQADLLAAQEKSENSEKEE